MLKCHFIVKTSHGDSFMLFGTESDVRFEALLQYDYPEDIRILSCTVVENAPMFEIA